MELIILDKVFDPIGFVDTFESLIWDRKYYEPGCFELYGGIELFDLFRRGAYIYCRDFAETGLIECVGHSQGANGRTAFAKGRFLEALLSNRVIHTVQSLNGTTEDVIYSLVESFGGDLVTFAPKSGLGETINCQVTGANLLEKCFEIAKSQELSIRLNYDYDTNKKLFSVWKGKDRTESQAENTWATFSDGYENINTASYQNDLRDYRNFAYVAGEGEGADREVVTVDLTDGKDKHELWVDARDLRLEDSPSLQEYRMALYQRGVEKLAEYSVNETIDAAIHQASNLVYKKDYDIGDLCTYIDNQTGIVVEQRITGITEIIENNQHIITPVFGEDNKTILQKLKREVS